MRVQVKITLQKLFDSVYDLLRKLIQIKKSRLPNWAGFENEYCKQKIIREKIIWIKLYYMRVPPIWDILCSEFKVKIQMAKINVCFSFKKKNELTLAFFASFFLLCGCSDVGMVSAAGYFAIGESYGKCYGLA